MSAGSALQIVRSIPQYVMMMMRFYRANALVYEERIERDRLKRVMSNSKKDTGFNYLIKNVGLLTIGSFSAKLLSFFLVPLYTSVLSTEDYGSYDLIHTTVQLLIPFLTLKIDEAVMRFLLDKREDQKGVFTVGVKYMTFGTIAVCIFTAINHYFGLFDVIDRFWFLFIIMYTLSSFLNLMIMFVRGLEYISDIAISGVIASAVMIACNLIFLLPMHLGLLGYFMASIIGAAVHLLYLIIKPKCWRYLKSWKCIDKEQQKRMIRYSSPMIANSVSWWINNASDRYIVTWICGVADNGIYSVAYKIPTILSVLQNIFLQAWTISAVKDFDSKDKNGFFSKLYNSYNFMMVASCSIIIVLDKPLASFLYANNFYDAWRFVPFLLISSVFGALAGYIGGIFSAVKDSRMYALSTTVGAVVNTMLNIALVFMIGPLGASIATAAGYFFVWLMRLHYMRQYIHMKMYLIRDFISYGMLVGQAVALILIPNGIATYIIQICILMSILLLYMRELKFAYEKIYSTLRIKK